MPLLFSRRTILAHGAALAASAVTPSLFTSFDASAQVGEDRAAVSYTHLPAPETVLGLV